MKYITRVLPCLFIGVIGKYDVQSKSRNECFDYDIGYPFNDVDIPSLASNGDSSTKSEFACQKSCQELLQCQFWSWNNKDIPFLLLVVHSRFSVGSPT